MLQDQAEADDDHVNVCLKWPGCPRVAALARHVLLDLLELSSEVTTELQRHSITSLCSHQKVAISIRSSHSAGSASASAFRTTLSPP